MGIERSIEKSQQETSKTVSAVSVMTAVLEYIHIVLCRHSEILMLLLIKYVITQQDSL